MRRGVLVLGALLACACACGSHHGDAAPAHPSTPACALDTSYSFGTTGGLVDACEWRRLSPPLTYTAGARRRGERANECVNTMACGEGIASNLLRALADSDVARAFVSNVRVYGFDPRAADGQVYFVRRADGRTITVGGECTVDTGPACVPIPPGVRRLVEHLRALETHVWVGGTCRDLPTAPAVCR